MNILPWIIFTLAALLEVSGDAVIRRGLRSRSAGFLFSGAAALAFYGLVVNSVKWDFSRLLGVYIAFFATISVLFGHFVFGEHIPRTTWCGLGLIICGGLVIQFGHK